MLQKAEGRAFQVEKLAAVFADEVHLGFAATRTRVTVLKFVVLFGAYDLHDARFFKTRKIAVNSAWRNRWQLACNVGSLENPVWIFGDKIHNQLPCLRFVFHISLCSECMKFTWFVRANSICKSFANSNIAQKMNFGNRKGDARWFGRLTNLSRAWQFEKKFWQYAKRNSRHRCRKSLCCSKEECMKKTLFGVSPIG